MATGARDLILAIQWPKSGPIIAILGPLMAKSGKAWSNIGLRNGRKWYPVTQMWGTQ
jgi:hypothetical protein